MEFLDIIDAITENVTIYVDKNDKNRLYAEYPGPKGEQCFSTIGSTGFRSYLYVSALEHDSDGIDVNKALKHIELTSHYNGDAVRVNVYNRIAGDLEEGIEYDLQNARQESVKIDAEGWEISPKKRKFIVPRESLMQVRPVETDKNPIMLLKKYLNLTGDALILFVVWIIHCFCHGAHYGVVLSASPGAGKTTIGRCARALIDPSDMEVVRFPDKKDDLCLILSNSYFICFDNLDAASIGKDESDILCGAITGSAMVKRALYTTGELAVFRMHCALLMNGLDATPAEVDLADRLLSIKATRVSSKKRLTDKELTDSFKKDLPEIMGSIFNTLSIAMSLYGSIDRSNLPRMAEAYANAASIAKALGISEEEFRRIFDENKSALDQSRTANPVVESVIEFMNRPDAKTTESGFVAEMFKKIKANYSGSSASIAGSASSFSRKLKLESAALSAANITVTFGDNGAKGTLLTIQKE